MRTLRQLPVPPWAPATLVLAGALAFAASPAFADPAPATPVEPRALVTAVLRAVQDAEADLARMPFFVRPMARGGFRKRTGASFEEWKERLQALASNDTAGAMRARWPGLEAALPRLVDNFRTTPERARRGMGNNEALLKEVTEKAAQRAAAAQALLDWLKA